MKTAIITLGLSDNYGAILQTCALADAVEALGHNTEVFRYQNWARITYGMSAVSRVKHFCFECIKACLTQNQRKKRFTAFREAYIPLTQKLYGNNDELRADPGDYDVYISGSDQIWNPLLFLFDYSYFLDFVPEGKKKISFASSFSFSSLRTWSEISVMESLVYTTFSRSSKRMESISSLILFKRLLSRII